MVDASRTTRMLGVCLLYLLHVCLHGQHSHNRAKIVWQKVWFSRGTGPVWGLPATNKPLYLDPAIVPTCNQQGKGHDLSVATNPHDTIFSCLLFFFFWASFTFSSPTHSQRAA